MEILAGSIQDAGKKLKEKIKNVRTDVPELSNNDIAELYGQLADLQSALASQITEIESLQNKVSDQEQRILELEGFKKALKLRLRQSQENQL